MYLRRVMERREELSREDARAVMAQIFSADLHGMQVAALLGALAARGETAAEMAGFVDAMQAAAEPFPLSEQERSALVDTCGTGGDGSGTFNISTAAALVAAAAGAKVAKHGNRAVTSRCGSADVLEALGIPVNLTPKQGAEALREYGFAFLHAPSLHPAMKAVMPVRQALGVRTVFNVLGPLVNPAGAAAQVMGVYSTRLVPLVAKTMALLGNRRAFVVCGETGPDNEEMDELSISGASHFAEVKGDEIRLGTLVPEDFGMTRAPLPALKGGDAKANAATLWDVFTGATGPRREVVVLNAGAVLMTAALAANLTDGIQLARSTIDAGKVQALVSRLGKYKK